MLKKLTEACLASDYMKLSWLQAWPFRDETIRRRLAFATPLT